MRNNLVSYFSIFFLGLIISNVTSSADAQTRTTGTASKSNDPFLAQATATPAAGTTATSTAVVKEDKKPWSVVVGADQYFGFYENTGQYTSFTLNPSYKIDDRNTVLIVQGIDKYYEVPQIGGEEFSFSDMSLRHVYLLNPDVYGWSLKWRTSATLPISTLSRDQGNITKLGGMAIASRKFFDIFTFTYRPFISYAVNQYTTSVGGKPLKLGSVGNYVEGQIDFTDKFNLFNRFMAQYNAYERTAYDSKPRQLEGDYLFESYLGYDVLKNMSAHVGYSYSDSMIKQGRYEMNIYDVEKSRWLMGVEFNF